MICQQWKMLLLHFASIYLILSDESPEGIAALSSCPGESVKSMHCEWLTTAAFIWLLTQQFTDCIYNSFCLAWISVSPIPCGPGVFSLAPNAYKEK